MTVVLPQGPSGHDILTANLLCAQALPGGAPFELAECTRIRDEWTERIRRETERQLHVFKRDPASFEHSEARYRVTALITVLQRDLGVHYPARFNAMPDDQFFARPEHLFVHGPLLRREGTCSSLPPTIASIGRLLGYPLKIVKTFQHRFLRWDGGGERFNIETTSQGFLSHPDEHYLCWPRRLSAEQVSRHRCLVSMEPQQEVALFLADRAQLLSRHGRTGDASFAYARACQLDAEDWGWRECLVGSMNAWKGELDAMMMRGFPAVTINFPPRRFPAVPLDLERGLIHMAAKQDFLNDDNMRAKWWEPLRAKPDQRPPDLPSHIAVTFRADPPHEVEYLLSRELPKGFKADRPA